MQYRFSVAVLALGCIFVAFAAGQRNKKDIPYADMPIRPTKEKAAQTRPLAPLPKEPQPAVTAATARLAFQTSPMVSRGLLSSQVREALKSLLRAQGSAEIVSLRAFVAGSGDMRRVQDIEAEVFADRRQLPALTVVQVGALPLPGAQVVIESTAEARATVNPNGVAFIAAQPASSVKESVAKVKALLDGAGMRLESILRMTCYVSSLEDAGAQPAGVPVPVDMIQMQREPARPNAACEAVARSEQPQSEPLRFVDGQAGTPAMALVGVGRIVISGQQLGFGAKDEDVKLAFVRLEKDLTSVKGDLRRSVMVHCYLISRSTAEQVRRVRSEFEGPTLPASTVLAFEGLPSIDAVFAVDTVTLPAAE